jgi:hypothetical protein
MFAVFGKNEEKCRENRPRRFANVREWRGLDFRKGSLVLVGIVEEVELVVP